MPPTTVVWYSVKFRERYEQPILQYPDQPLPRSHRDTARCKVSPNRADRVAWPRRQRLKGFGHGVRKVQNAGKNQAVIIHTATGRHLEELETKFADVGFSAIESDLSEPIQNLRNLGSASAAWLREIDVFTIADLERLGPVLAYRLVKQWHRNASLNVLWAMAAGLTDKDWQELTDDEKARLIGELDKE